jgi:hypothetical protein
MAGTTTKKLTTVLYTKYVRNTKNNPPKNNEIFFPPNLSRLQNNLPENNVRPVPAKSQITRLRFGGKKFHIIFWRIVLEAAQIWREPQQKTDYCIVH